MANLPPVSTTPAATLPPVLMTLGANFATSSAGVVDTHVEVANRCQKDTSGKYWEQYQTPDTLK